eukprot:3388938-Pyramimonas_sp.AAC.1
MWNGYLIVKLLCAGAVAAILQFFGTCEYAWVMGTEILKWSKGLEKKLHQKKGKTFKYGLEDILELVQADFDPTKYPEGW